MRNGFNLVDLARGMVSNRPVFYSTADVVGRVDGAACDSEGNFWCALVLGGAVGCILPEGKLIEQIDMPAKHPTMVAFGGPDLTTLNVISASSLRAPEEAPDWPHAGKLFRIEGLGTRGLPEPVLGHRGARPGHLPGQPVSLQRGNWVQTASESLYLIVQVETLTELGNHDEIAAAEGVDAVLFGPGELPVSMGKLGQPADPDVTALIDDAAARMRRAGKGRGVFEFLRKIDLDVAEGEFVVVDGPSGCGKITSLRMLAGL